MPLDRWYPSQFENSQHVQVIIANCDRHLDGFAIYGLAVSWVRRLWRGSPRQNLYELPYPETEAVSLLMGFDGDRLLAPRGGKASARVAADCYAGMLAGRRGNGVRRRIGR